MFSQPVSPPVAHASLGPARGRFLLVAAGLYMLWLLVYEGFVGPEVASTPC